MVWRGTFRHSALITSSDYQKMDPISGFQFSFCSGFPVLYNELVVLMCSL